MKKSKFNPGKIFTFLVFVLASSIIPFFSVRAQEANYNDLIKKYTGTTDTSKGSSPSNPVPIFSFPNIKPDDTINGNISFKIKLPLIQGLTIYLIPEGSTVPKASASAKKSDGDYWSVVFDSKNVPDGNYYLSAKIKYINGEIEATKIKVKIDNSASKQTAPITQQKANAWMDKINSIDSAKLQQNVDTFFDSMLSAEWLNKYFHISACTDKAICGSQADPDNDSLSNIEEFRLNTDPTNPDTDSDGYSDGDEIQNGFDPLKYSPGHQDDKIIFQNAKENGQLKADIYKVLDVIGTKTGDSKTFLATIKGKALPNSFVTVYVYSDLPIILTIKTDSSGNWSYDLEKEIGDGQHQVYVAVTDSTGQINAKSEPLFFIKTAQAVSVIAPGEIANAQQVASPVENRQNSYMLISVSIIIATLLIALAVIGTMMSSRNKRNLEKNNEETT